MHITILAGVNLFIVPQFHFCDLYQIPPLPAHKMESLQRNHITIIR